MSINTAHAHGGVLIFNGEIILLYCDGVELAIEGISSKEFNGTKKGRIYLTTHRMIFLNKSEKDNLQSFSFPFFSLSAVELEQPIFGANFIKGLVNAQAGGNWSGKATFTLKFFKGGAIEFGQAMLRAAKMANQHMPPQPPPYTPHYGPYYPAPPPAYMAPAGGVNGFVPPTHVFPDAPPANSVYTMDMPPPYPGIYPPPYAYAPGSQMYPQAGPNGLINQPSAGPPPPGFSAPGAPPQGAYPGAPPQGAYPGAPPQGAYPGAPPQGGYPGAPPQGAYPPPYNPAQFQGAPGAPAQYNGMAQQPPSNETKASAPPVYDFYQSPYNQQTLYSNTNGHGNPQGPPPPYFTEEKKDQ